MYYLRYCSRIDLGLLKFEKDKRKIEYLKQYNNLRDKFKNDSFLTSLLKEVSMISYDYTDKLRLENNRIHIIMNMNNKYIYPAIVSMNSILKNSNVNKTTIVYHILCPEDLKRGNLNKLSYFIYYLNLFSIWNHIIIYKKFSFIFNHPNWWFICLINKSSLYWYVFNCQKANNI